MTVTEQKASRIDEILNLIDRCLEETERTVVTEQERMDFVVSRWLGEPINVIEAVFPSTKPEHFSVLIEYPETGYRFTYFVPCSVIIDGKEN